MKLKFSNILRSQKVTAQKMNFAMKDFFRKCDQIRSFPRIWSHILKKSLMENFILCAVSFKLYAMFCTHFDETPPKNF